MDTIEGMKVFVKVAEQLGFSSAARQLGISKALVSKYVKQLEERLNVRLLERTTRGVSLTETGKSYYERCVVLLADFDELESSIAEHHASPRGTLKLTAPTDFGEMFLVSVISNFMNKYPSLSINLNLTDRFVSLVDEGYDMAIRISELPDSNMIAKRLGPSRLITYASPEYLDQKKIPVTPDDLEEHKCIIDVNSQLAHRWHFIINGEKRYVSVNGQIRANGARVSRDLAKAGHGIARSPYFAVARDIEKGLLIPLLEPYEYTKGAIYAIYPHNRHLSAKTRLFIDYLYQTMQSADLNL